MANCVGQIVTTPLTYWAARDPPLDPAAIRRFDWAEVCLDSYHEDQ